MIKNIIKQAYLLYLGWQRVKCTDGDIIWFAPWNMFWMEEWSHLDDAVWEQAFVRDGFRPDFLLE